MATSTTVLAKLFEEEQPASSNPPSSSSILSPKKQIVLASNADFLKSCVTKDKYEHLGQLRATSFEAWTYFEAQKAAVSAGASNKSPQDQKQERLNLIPALIQHYQAKAVELKYAHQLVKQVMNGNKFSTNIQSYMQSVSDELHALKYVALGHVQALQERRDILQESAPSMEPPDVDLFLISALSRYGHEFSRETDKAMRAEAIAWLGFGKDELGLIKPKGGGPQVQNFGRCWCPISWRYKDKNSITSAHCVPAAVSSDLLGRLLGKKHSVMSKDNSLPMSKTLERLWDENAFTIVPKEPYSQSPEEYKMIVLQDDIPKKYSLAGDMNQKLVWPKDYHHRELKFPTDKRPSKTYLFNRHRCQMFYMADKGGQSWYLARKHAWNWTAEEGILSRPFIYWLAEQINNPDFATTLENGLRNVEDFPRRMEYYEVAEFAAATFSRSIRPLWLNLTSRVPPALSTPFFSPS